MATRTRSNMRSERSEVRTGPTRNSNGGMRGALQDLKKGIHVTAEMPDPKVARITIDIEWQHLVSRVAREVGRTVKRRVSGGRTTSRRTGSRVQSSHS